METEQNNHCSKLNFRVIIKAIIISACITHGGEIVAAGDVVTNKPKPRGAASRDDRRVSLCMAILIPSPELSGGDKAVKVVVVPYRVSGLI